MNEAHVRDVLEDAAERGTPRGADEVFGAASVTAVALQPVTPRGRAARRRTMAAASVVLVLIGGWVAFGRRGAELQITTQPPPDARQPDVASADVSCSVLSFWEVTDPDFASPARSVIVGRLGTPSSWMPTGPSGFGESRRTWTFEQWATEGADVTPAPVTSVAQTRAPSCGPAVELHEGDVIVSAIATVTKPGEVPVIGSQPSSVFFVVNDEGAPPPGRDALLDSANRVRSSDGAPACDRDPCTWAELVTEIGDPARRPGPRIRGTLRMTGGPNPGANQGIPGTIEIRGETGEVRTVPADADGRFEVRVRNGRYEVSATSPVIDEGQTRCVAPEPVVVRVGRDAAVDVRCAIL